MLLASGAAVSAAAAATTAATTALLQLVVLVRLLLLVLLGVYLLFELSWEMYDGLSDVRLLLFLLWCSDAPTKEYTYRYSMMHRRLTTAGIEVALHYHQLLIKHKSPYTLW